MRAHVTVPTLVTLAVSALVATSAGATELSPGLPTPPSTAFRFTSVPDDTVTGAGTASAEASAEASAHSTAAPSKNPFGKQGSLRWLVQGGGGLGDDDQYQGLAGGGISWCFADHLTLDLELNGVFYSQPDDDAWAINPVLLFRWHLLPRDTWSLYLDGGAGIQWASENTPPGGRRFGFTPQVGAGVSFEVAPDVRMLIGARWRHVSNANTSEDNSGLDTVYVYAQLSLPF